MLSIDEAIKQFKYDAECNRADLDLSYAEDNEQVAAWLEELKQLREQTTWISCSDRLPEIRQDCLVTVRYTGFMGMHGFWVKTGHMESENDWCGDCSGGEVIAWQPLPQPYQTKGE